MQNAKLKGAAHGNYKIVLFDNFALCIKSAVFFILLFALVIGGGPRQRWVVHNFLISPQGEIYRVTCHISSPLGHIESSGISIVDIFILR